MIWFILGALGFVLDIVTKNYISLNFKIGESIPIIQNVFHITYHVNSGAAFGMFQNQRLLLIIITGIIVAGVILYLIFEKPHNRFVLCGLSLILSGALGNLSGRIIKGAVVDFLDFRLINFPIFNIADSCVFIGACLLIIYVFKSEDRGNAKK